MIIMKGKSMKKSAFTLIELLVVISIIAVLMAIMMPALRKAREQGRTVICMSRLKDLGTMLNLYGQDYGGAIPASYPLEGEKPPADGFTRWPIRLSGYYQIPYKWADPQYTEYVFRYKLFGCPTNDKFRKVDEPIGPPYGETAWRGFYGMNIFFTRYGSQDRFDFRYSHQIKNPSSLPMMADTDGTIPSWWGDKANSNIVLFFQGPHPKADEYSWEYQGDRSKYIQYGPAPNHGGKTNYLFADGHTEKMGIWPWSDFKGTDFHPLGIKQE